MAAKQGNSAAQTQANQSGFPFQMALAAAIKAQCSQSWRVLGEEVPWLEGFADIVTWHEDLNVLAVIECKRLDACELVFPIDSSVAVRAANLCLEIWVCQRCQQSLLPHAHHASLLYEEGAMVEPSYEAGFCVAPKGKPFGSLEAICRELYQSAREIGQRWAQQHNGKAILLPIVATNAPLAVCLFEPNSVPLGTGRIENADTSVERFVRYRKSFENEAHAKSAKEQRRARSLTAELERTALVVNAESLTWFLNAFHALKSAGA